MAWACLILFVYGFPYVFNDTTVIRTSNDNVDMLQCIPNNIHAIQTFDQTLYKTLESFLGVYFQQQELGQRQKYNLPQHKKKSLSLQNRPSI